MWSRAPEYAFSGNPELSTLPFFLPMLAVVVVIFAYISVPPALLPRKLWRLGYRRSAWIAGVAIAIAIATVFVIGRMSDGLEEFKFDLWG